MTPKFVPEKMRCPWDGCLCTHDIGVCVAGWIDSDERTAACPTCRPEVEIHLRQALDLKFARAGLPALKRQQVTPW